MDEKHEVTIIKYATHHLDDILLTICEFARKYGDVEPYILTGQGGITYLYEKGVPIINGKGPIGISFTKMYLDVGHNPQLDNMLTQGGSMNPGTGLPMSSFIFDVFIHGIHRWTFKPYLDF